MTGIGVHSTLLVEGNDDKHVVANLLRMHNLHNIVDIKNKEGFDQLRDSIYNEVNESGRKALGILADANCEINGRWRSIYDRLDQAGCKVPKKISHSGSIFIGPRDVRVGVWIMPDNNRSGELEDFIHDMIPANDPVLPRAKIFIDNIPAEDRKFSDSKITKAYVHAWLATRKKPRPMGTAIVANDLDHNVEVANSFVIWIRNLFEL